MVDITLYYIELDQLMHFLTVILIVYLIFRDNKTLNAMNNRYDKLIGEILDTISKQQEKYKNELSNDIRELSSNMIKVSTAVGQVVSGVKDVENEVSKVDKGVNEVVGAVSQVAEGVKIVTDAVSEVVVSVKDVRTCDLELSQILKLSAEELKQTAITLNKISKILEKTYKIDEGEINGTNKFQDLKD